MKDKYALKYLWNQTKGQRINSLLLIITSAIFSVLSVLFALAVKQVVDGATKGNSDELIKGVIYVVAIILLQFIFRVVNKSLQEYIRGKLEINFKNHIFKSILKKNYSQISAFHSGELMNAMTSDVNIICDGLSEIIPEVFSSIVRLVVAIIVLLSINYIFAIAFLIAGILIFIICSLMRKKIKFFHKKAQETDGKTRAYYQENIENILAVKVFNTEDKVLDKSNELQNKNFEVKMKRRNYSVLGHAFFNLTASAGYVFALVYGGLMIYNKSFFGYGDLTAVLQLVNSVQMPFISLSSVVPKYFTMLASAERLIGIDKIEDEININDKEIFNEYNKCDKLIFENINFAYKNELVLENINLTINKNDIVAITGTSGNGKSTLLKLLLAVYNLNNGKIYFEGINKTFEISASTRKLFAYVPQGYLLFSGTIKDNLTFVNENATEDEIDLALKISDAYDFVSFLPDKLNTIIGESGKGLSEGQIQRLAIARAVLTNAPILLLDEATSALDESTEKTVLENLKNLTNKTVLIITHKKAALSICDKKILIENKHAVFYE